MKTLVLVRHAKSSWSNSQQSDFERPLNDRGFNDAPLMARVVDSLGVKPDFILTSAAKRALTTANFFTEHFGLNGERFHADKRLYDGNHRDYINMLNETDNKYNTVFLFGHNPEITVLASHLLPNFASHVPTAGCIAIDFDIDDWIDIESGKGKLRFFEYPKRHK